MPGLDEGVVGRGGVGGAEEWRDDIGPHRQGAEVGEGVAVNPVVVAADEKKEEGRSAAAGAEGHGLQGAAESDPGALETAVRVIPRVQERDTAGEGRRAQRRALFDALQPLAWMEHAASATMARTTEARVRE